MCRTLRFDGEGNDVTPMCEIADGIVLDDGCGECALKNDCPGYYDGCFEAVNGLNYANIDEIICRLSNIYEDIYESCGQKDREALNTAIVLLRERFGKKLYRCTPKDVQ